MKMMWKIYGSYLHCLSYDKGQAVFTVDAVVPNFSCG